MTGPEIDAILTLLAERAGGATICPSEAARRLAGPGGDWRAAMPQVHAAVDTLLARRAIILSWKGRALPQRRGPYRIAAAPDNAHTDAGAGAQTPGPSRPATLS
mgnify:CR=1 FL=1